MKYFFLTAGWTIGRVWEFGGLWDHASSWRRPPQIERLNIGILEGEQVLWLYKVEEAVIMVEVAPKSAEIADTVPTIGQVVLKRLISAEQVLEILQNAEELLRKYSVISDQLSVISHNSPHPTPHTPLPYLEYSGRRSIART